MRENWVREKRLGGSLSEVEVSRMRRFVQRVVQLGSVSRQAIVLDWSHGLVTARLSSSQQSASHRLSFNLQSSKHVQSDMIDL